MIAMPNNLMMSFSPTEAHRTTTEIEMIIYEENIIILTLESYYSRLRISGASARIMSIEKKDL